MSTTRGWIGVDLDGTLAYYATWVGPDHIGQPVPEMVARVKRWLAEGREVRIFTARVAISTTASGRGYGPAEAEAARRAIEAWCRLHVGQVLPITNSKDFAMIELWDDRVVQVRTNTGEVLGHSPRGLG